MLVGKESFTERASPLRSLSLVIPLEQILYPNRTVFLFTGKQMFVLLSQLFSHHKGDSSQWHFLVQAALLSSENTIQQQKKQSICI